MDYATIKFDTIQIEKCNFIKDEYINSHEINKVYYNTISKKKIKFRIYSTDDIFLTASSIVYIYLGKKVYMEFVSEGLENMQVSFKCAHFGYMDFMFDNRLITNDTLWERDWITYNFTIPYF